MHIHCPIYLVSFSQIGHIHSVMAAAKARVLVVEDHAATARGLKMFLEISGHSVELARDMKTALKSAADLEFDVLLCDLNLPDGSGWELMERLKERRPLRAIAFSAFDEAEHIERSRAVGFAEHVVKGSTPEGIVDAIDRVMRGEVVHRRNERARL